MKEGNWIIIDYGDVIVHVFKRKSAVTITWTNFGQPLPSLLSRQNISGKGNSLKIHTVWVGKTQEEWVRDAIAEYTARIGRYISLEIRK